MVVAFFGTPAFAVPTLAALVASTHRVCGVVTQPDRPRGRGHHVSPSPVKAFAVEHGLPVFQPTRLSDPSVAEALAAWTPDLGVVVAYGKLLPQTLLDIPRLGMVNVHASLLPRYRGAAPIHRAVMSGDTETGITIMQVVLALDAGDMLATRTRAIDPDETSEQVEGDLARLGAALLVDVVDALARGPVAAERQDGSAATYAAKITAADAPIDWTQPAGTIHNQVRGLVPWPRAQTSIDGVRIKVLRTHLVDAAVAAVSGTAAEPGTVVHVDRDSVHVATGAGIIALDELQADGRRPMTTREFLAGRAIRIATRLGLA